MSLAGAKALTAAVSSTPSSVRRQVAHITPAQCTTSRNGRRPRPCRRDDADAATTLTHNAATLSPLLRSAPIASTDTGDSDPPPACSARISSATRLACMYLSELKGEGSGEG